MEEQAQVQSTLHLAQSHSGRKNTQSAESPQAQTRNWRARTVYGGLCVEEAVSIKPKQIYLCDVSTNLRDKEGGLGKDIYKGNTEYTEAKGVDVWLQVYKSQWAFGER